MKKLYISPVFFLASICIGFSQNPLVDSLRKVLPEVEGQQKIDVLQRLVVNLWLNHPDSAMQYAREAVSLAKESGDVRSQAIAIRVLGGVHLYQGTYDSA